MRIILQVFILSLFASYAAAVDFSPYNKPDAPLWKDVVRKPIADGFRALVFDAFHERGKQDPERTEEFNSHMKTAIDMVSGYYVSENKVREIFERVNVQSRWHPDSMAKWTTAIICDGTTHQRSKLTQKWVEAMKVPFTDLIDERPRYNPIITVPIVMKYFVLVNQYYSEKNADHARRSLPVVAEFFKGGLNYGDDIPAELLFDMMDNLTIKNLPHENGDLATLALELFTPLFNEAPIEPWVRDGLLGILHYKVAWAYRGSGYSNTVTTEGWKGFHEHLKTALERLEASWNAHPHPMVAGIGYRLSQVAKGVSSSETWQQRAFSSCLDNRIALNTLAIYQLPRWGGSHAQVIATAQACHAADRYDTYLGAHVAELYATAIFDGRHHHQKHVDSDNLILKDPAVRKTLDQWLEKTIAVNTDDPMRQNFARTRHAIFVYLGASKEEGLELLSKMEKPANEIFKEYGLKRKEIMADIKAEPKPPADQVDDF